MRKEKHLEQQVIPASARSYFPQLYSHCSCTSQLGDHPPQRLNGLPDKMTKRLKRLLGGEGEIRTLGGALKRHGGLANRWFRPLTHLSEALNGKKCWLKLGIYHERCKMHHRTRSVVRRNRSNAPRSASNT